MAYNPFDKPIDKITSDDLEVLISNEIAEGYFVEYKGNTFPENHKIGKSISSFANTYGGWYIIGVNTDENNIASEICGFSRTDYPDPISKIREIIKSHIDPIPVFFITIVTLDKDRNVLLVNVPGEQETPFINKDGRIYRRTSDSSEPIFETDRFSIDRLVDQGRNISEKFGKFCSDSRTFSQAEENQGWVNIFLSPYPLGHFQDLEIRTREGLEGLIRASQKPVTIRGRNSQIFGTGNVSFDSGQVTPYSTILRQTNVSKTAFNTLTAEFFVDGRAKISIPVELYPKWEMADFQRFNSHLTSMLLTKLWQRDSSERNLWLLDFFNFESLWAFSAILLSFYQQWIQNYSPISSTRFSIILENVWRYVPFVDFDAWGEYIDKFGLPVSHNNSVNIPEDISKGIIIDFENNPIWQAVVYFTALGFGIPLSLHVDIINYLSKKHFNDAQT